MKSILNLSSLLIYIFIFANNLFYSPSSFSKQKSEINLDNELVKGNLLIGLKQHIGSNPKQILKNYSLNFKSSSNFLTLKSFNGIEHKSKEIKIIWKKIQKYIINVLKIKKIFIINILIKLGLNIILY